MTEQKKVYTLITLLWKRMKEQIGQYPIPRFKWDEIAENNAAIAELFKGDADLEQLATEMIIACTEYLNRKDKQCRRHNG